MTDVTDKYYDIFLSFSGEELDRVVEIKERLDALGYVTFLDRTENRPSDSVTDNIERALRNSRMCVFNYSERFAWRNACQFELAQALIADAKEAGPTRLFVINAEGKNNAHIAPVELRDRIYIEDDQSPAALDRVVAAILERHATLTGTFQHIDFQALPRCYFGASGYEPRIRRYSAILALHSALNRRQHRMTQPPSNNTAVLAGLPGSGKTKLVEDYVLHFGFAYDTVVWIDLRDEIDSALETYTAKASQVTAAGQVLWIVDNVSPDLDEPVVRKMIFHGRRSHTVLITHQEAFRSLGEYVRLDRLTEDEGVQLFALCRKPATDQKDVVKALVNRVHGHPMAIAQLGVAATERQGLGSLLEHVGRVLDGSSDTMDQVAGVFADRLRTVTDETELLLLQLSSVVAAEPVPARFIRDVMRRMGIAEDRVVAGVSALSKALFASQDNHQWIVHPVVRQAVRRHLDIETRVATAAAEVLLGYDDEDTLPHAQYLADNDTLSADIVGKLLRRIACRLRDSGRPCLAARYFDRLADAGATDTYLDGATAHFEAGEYAPAARLASRVRGDQEWSAAVILAASLDALGRLDEADAAWDRVATPEVLSDQPSGANLEARLRWIRGQRLRGSLKEHRDFLAAVVSRSHDLPEHTANTARLELANSQMWTDQQHQARANARQVVDYYERRHQTHHPQAIEAQFVSASADLLVHFLEFKPDASKWPDAEKTFREMAAELAESLGDRNIQVLTTRVAIGLALINQGKATEARTHATDLLAVLRGALDDGHPLVSRCRYVLGMAHFQLAEFDAATSCLTDAHSGQLAVFGRYHQETLRTQYELGVALKIRGEHRRANELLDGVRMAAPKVTGRVNDLYGQAAVATTLGRYLPSWLLRMAHRANHKDKW